MPSASAYTSKMRFVNAVKNTKVELPSHIGNLTQRGIAGCGLNKNYENIDYVELCKCGYVPPPDLPPPPPLPPIWAKYRGDSKNTGLSPYPGPTTSNIKWMYTSPSGSGIYSSPAIGSDGTIYIGSDDGGLYAINTDGTLKWRFSAGSQIRSSPAIGSDGTIYVGSEDQFLYAINPNGTLKWKFQTGSTVTSSPAIGSDGTLYVGAGSGFLYAINANGTLKWAFDTGSITESSPAIGSDGTLYIISGYGILYAITPDGNPKWFSAIGTILPLTLTSPAIGPDGTIYVAINPSPTVEYPSPNSLYAFNPDGTLKWSAIPQSFISVSPAIGPDGTVYVSSGVAIIGLNPTNGQVVVNFPTYLGLTAPPIIGSDGTMYIQDNVFVTAINTSTFQVIWDYNIVVLGKQTSPAISSNGTLYFGTPDGRVIAIQD